MKLALSVVLGCLLAAACAEGARTGELEGEDHSVPEAERYGGTAVIANIWDIDDIDPLTSTLSIARRIARDLLFMPLVAYDAGLEPRPYLARSWEVSPDTTMLTFHLRDDVYWHDGVKTTAYDVKFSYDRVRDPETAFVDAAFWTYYGEAEVLDSFTFRVRMRPHAGYMEPWATFPPVPRHILEDVPPAELRRHPFGHTRPLGNGPFRFLSRAPGQNWVFAANERFPEELGGRPYLDRIVYRAIPEQTTLLAELLTGGIDGYIDMRPDQRRTAEASGRIRVRSYRWPGLVYIAWNGRRPLFRDARVRRALTLAIDRQAIIDGILYGEGDVANSMVSPMLWNYDPSAGADLGYDPAAARRLLAEAGWEDRDGNGVIEDEQGREFRFTIKTNKGNQIRADIIEKLQADLRKVGIAAAPRIMEFNTMLAQIQDPRSRDFDAALAGWGLTFRVDDTDRLHCDRLDGPYQVTGFCDPELDRLLDTLPLMVDTVAARPLWREYQRKFAEQQPYTLLYYPHFLMGLSHRLQNVHPDARGEWSDARRWWILPGERTRTPTTEPEKDPTPKRR